MNTSTKAISKQVLVGTIAGILFLGSVADIVVAQAPQAVSRGGKTDARKHFYSGCAWLRKGEYNKAIAHYTEAIRLNPEYADAVSILGVTVESKEQRIARLKKDLIRQLGTPRSLKTLTTLRAPGDPVGGN